MAKRTVRRDIRRFLKAEQQTQRWLAEEVGIAPSTLTDILKGRRQPSLPVAVNLARITGVPAEAFVQR